MALGRGFLSEPDRRPGASLLAVISYDYWMTRFGGRRRRSRQDAHRRRSAVTIVGVTARGFHGLNAGERFQITLPMSVMALDSPRFFDDNDGWVGPDHRRAAGRRRRASRRRSRRSRCCFSSSSRSPENGWVELADPRPISIRGTRARRAWHVFTAPAVLETALGADGDGGRCCCSSRARTSRFSFWPGRRIGPARSRCG